MKRFVLYLLTLFVVSRTINTPKNNGSSSVLIGFIIYFSIENMRIEACLSYTKKPNTNLIISV